MALRLTHPDPTFSGVMGGIQFAEGTAEVNAVPSGVSGLFAFHGVAVTQTPRAPRKAKPRSRKTKPAPEETTEEGDSGDAT